MTTRWSSGIEASAIYYLLASFSFIFISDLLCLTLSSVFTFHRISTFLTFLLDMLVLLFTAIYPIFSLKFPINSSSDNVMYCHFTMLSQPVAICIIADLSFVWHILYFNNISLFSIMCLIQSVLNLGLEQLLWWLLLLFSSIQSWAIPMIFSLPLLQCFS